jgi:hypothetical protein
MSIRAPLSPLATSDLHCSKMIPASTTAKHTTIKYTVPGIPLNCVYFSYNVNRLSVGYVNEFCFDQKQQHNPFPSFLLNLVDLLTELLSVFQVYKLSGFKIK